MCIRDFGKLTSEFAGFSLCKDEFLLKFIRHRRLANDKDFYQPRAFIRL